MKRALVALALVAGLAACGQSPPAELASPRPVASGSAAVDPHAGHDHPPAPVASGSAAVDPHAGHDHPPAPVASGSAAVDPHAGHDHPPGEHPSGPPLEAAMGTNPDPPVAGEPAEVGFRVVRGGQPLRDYDTVHEKKAHLVIVSADLADFQHLHPDLDEAGIWRTPVTFPEPNLYRFYLDVTPTGDVQQVLRSQLQVPGSTPDRAPLRPDYGPAKVDGVEVAMQRTPSHLKVGDAHLNFVLTRDGKPVTDLEPYLGEKGHLVIVDQSGEQFLHAHPAAGDAIAFHATFPKPGLYKLWAQFLVGGKVLTAPFVVHVE